jgi:hypothetical protein
MKTTSELQIEYDALLNEYKTLKKLIEDAEEAKKRLDELKPSSLWGNSQVGLLENVKRQLEDSKYPIFTQDKWYISRIINIDNKWIRIKDDGGSKITKYKRDTGWQEHSRDGYFHIDHIKALEIWEKFQAEKDKK